jgi:hypothetical protein
MRILGFLAGVAGLLVIAGGAAAAPPDYHGGLFDDGFYDDDWYVDYYDSPVYDEQARTGMSGGDDEYDATQFYDDAGESGLFDV